MLRICLFLLRKNIALLHVVFVGLKKSLCLGRKFVAELEDEFSVGQKLKTFWKKIPLTFK